MDKIKISEVAAELGTTPKEVIKKAKEIDIVLKTAQSNVTSKEAGIIGEYIESGKIPDNILKKQEAEKAEKQKIADKKEREEQQKIIKASIKKTPPAKEVIVKPVVEEKKEIIPVEKKQEKAKEETSDAKIVQEQKTTPTKEKLPQNLSVKRSKQPVQEVLEKEVVKKEKKQPKQTKVKKQSSSSTKQKITIDVNFSTDIDIDSESSNVLMPDFDAREDILKKFEKANNLLNKNRQNNTNRPRNQFASRRSGSERRSKKRYPKSGVKEVQAIKIPIDVRMHEFAYKTNIEESHIIEELLNLGLEIGKNDFLEKDHMELLADTFDLKIQFESDHLDEINYVEKYNSSDSDDKNTETRIPVITIMGHIDHGKTSLLDVIRKTKVVDGEAGGITQHIGAYMIDFKGQSMTFVDTPGHAVFDSMRSRGAKITDIIVIVVAADDGVKDQTIESIKHAKKSGVPIIVAITKIDRPEINIDVIKSKMAEFELTASDWGGDIDFIPLSSKTKEGVDLLLETISVQAELLECKANPNQGAKGVILEASLELGKGPTATLIVQDGTLKIGDYVVSDTVSGKIRAMSDDNSKPIKQATPGMPVKITGLNDLPPTGSILISMNSVKEVKALAEKRNIYKRQLEMSKTTRISIEDVASMISENKLTSLPIILKADFNGSLEAIKTQVEGFRNDEVKAKIVSADVGGITEKDIDLAGVTDNCVIFGFNVRPTGAIKQKADKNNITIATYSIIYELLDEIKSLLSGLMSPIIKHENTGQAEVRDVFKTPKGIAVAGCIVSDGKVVKGGLVRVIREGIVICDDSKISSLKRFKDDAPEVKKGLECGVIIEDYNDVQVGDVIETFIAKEEKRQL